MSGQDKRPQEAATATTTTAHGAAPPAEDSELTARQAVNWFMEGKKPFREWRKHQAERTRKENETAQGRRRPAIGARGGAKLFDPPSKQESPPTPTAPTPEAAAAVNGAPGEGPVSERDEILDQIRALQIQLERLKAGATSWEARLAGFGIKPEEAYQIIEQVIIQGEPYEREVEVLRGVKVRFQTRPTQAQFDLDDLFETVRPQFPATSRSLAARNNLVHSLLAVGETELDPDTSEGRDATLRLLMKMDGSIWRPLAQALSEFDTMIATVFSMESVTNF